MNFMKRTVSNGLNCFFMRFFKGRSFSFEPLQEPVVVSEPCPLVVQSGLNLLLFLKFTVT